MALLYSGNICEMFLKCFGSVKVTIFLNNIYISRACHNTAFFYARVKIIVRFFFLVGTPCKIEKQRTEDTRCRLLAAVLFVAVKTIILAKHLKQMIDYGQLFIVVVTDGALAELPTTNSRKAAFYKNDLGGFAFYIEIFGWL